jgi:hypothetical protein
MLYWILIRVSSAGQPPTKNSHVARNVAIGIICIIILLVAFWAAWNRPTRYISNLVNGLLTINAGSYEYYSFTIPSGASDIQVSGSFTASGGSGNDIRIYILDSTSFTNWKNGHSVSTYYNSGQMTTGTISATLPSSGTYYLVYDNTFSLFSQKNVNTWATLSYTA